MTDQQLIALAARARRNAYAPFSNFKVGAALASAGGNVAIGCNVENSSYGLSICAERNAIAALVAAVGAEPILRLAIVANSMVTPCGACRQAIIEFGMDVQIISASAEELDNLRRWSISELIPNHFKL